MLCSIIFALLFVVPQLASAATANVTTDGAKKEGKLVLYSAMNQADSTKLIALYRSRYPFVDASFSTQGARRSSTESSLRQGRTDFYSMLFRQKFRTCSASETWIIGENSLR